MNAGIYRLVFDRRRGMRVPAAEHVNSAGRQTTRRRARVLAGVALLAAVTAAEAASRLPSTATVQPRYNLPRAAANFNQLGRATTRMDGSRRMVVDQTDRRVILNWDSFDIGKGYGVHFAQPSGGTALNRIGSSDPSVILGSLTATGEVILYNANGVLFGPTATVETGNFIATTLNIADSLFEKGFRNITDGSAAFAAEDSATGGFIRVESGAEIRALSGGDILMFAPRVLNEGTLSSPDGQVALAAGQKVYLTASRNAAERGFMVEVDPFQSADADLNTVENAARTQRVMDDGRLVTRVNEIVAERGNVTLVGLAVKQMGTVRATTAVKGKNGAIYLLAHGRTTTTSLEGGRAGELQRVAEEMGKLTVGPNSVTRVDPESGSATQTDAESFFNSIVRLEGRQIHLQGGARIVAPGAGGVTPKDTQNPEDRRGVTIVASEQPRNSPLFVNTEVASADASRIVIDPGVTIDVSGVDRTDALPMSRNLLTGRLFSIELADSPLQRQGVLYRTQIAFDARKGTDVADVSGFYNAIQRDARELLTGGGRIVIAGDGDVVVGKGAQLDVSGGSIRYAGGEMKTTWLRAGKRLIEISDARPDVVYDEVITPSRGRFEPGYTEGKDAGELVVGGRAVVLDATMSAGVVVGERQRGTGGDPLPAAGRLQVGLDGVGSVTPDYFVRDLSITASGATPLGTSFFKDPFNLGLGQRGEVTTLSAAAIGAADFGELFLVSNRQLSVASGVGFDLGVGGQFTAASGSVSLNGSILVPSGTVDIAARDTAELASGRRISVTMGSAARIDTAGRWVNDGIAGAGRTPDAVAIDGGSVSLSAQDDVMLAKGSTIDVSAGAWRTASRKVETGDAGSVALAANVGADPLFASGKVTLGGSLRGFGFDGGGRLSIASESINVSGKSASGLWLTPGFFERDGFSSISLKSLHDLTITSGTVVDPVLRNFILDARAGAQPSGAMTSAVASVDTLPAVDRDPVNLSFAATQLPAPVLGIGGADLLVGKGARVATEAGGALSFSAGENLTVAGTLEAPGGSVKLSVEGSRGGTVESPDQIGLIGSQALWLTDTARIFAAGTAETFTGPTGRTTGQVFGGGTVTLDAKRGYLVAEAGALVDIRGYETRLFPYASGDAVLISRDAGSLALGSAEGVFFDAQVRAQAPSSRAAGGSFTLNMSRRGLESFTAGGVTAYPDAERRIVVKATGDSLPANLAPGADLAAAKGNGVAEVSAQRIASAGFDSITLRADDRIQFAQSVNLSAPRSIQLDTRIVEGKGASSVSLSAPYIAIGDADIADISGTTQPSATAGSASLNLQADLIDVIGRSGLQGFASANFDATRGGRRDGEIRLIGRAQPNTNVQDGALLFSGTVTMTAGQIYPTTFSQFEITGAEGNSLFRTRMPSGGSRASVPLSAFGALTVTADRIEHGGVLRAPFGSIDLVADSLKLFNGSETSVSGNGATVPVGSTVNGRTWYYYPLGLNAGTQSSEIVTIDELPVAKGVLLKADSMDVASGARVSAAGGGDIQAAEFVAGTGGTQDYLSKPRLYAVLPGYSFDYAPFDSQIQTGFDLKPGTAITITMPGSGLAPGTYTLLPAAYALLPGAYVVSLAQDQGAAPLPSALRLTDGSTLVTGYLTAAGTRYQGDAYQRFLVEPSATFRAKAEYRITSANAFFSDRATRLGSDSVVRVPADAGRIALDAGQLPNWQALFDLTAPAGAKAGAFDLALANIALVDPGEAAPAGYTAVNAKALAATGAGSVLLGGVRTETDSGAQIETRASSVLVKADDAPVKLPELMLAATDKVTIADGVRIEANGAETSGAGTFSLQGDGAFVRVSNRTGGTVERSGVSRAGGDLALGAGTQLTGAEVDLDATGRMQIDARASWTAGAFSLATGRVAFGGQSPEGDAVVLSGGLLDNLLANDALTLRSYSSIDFLGPITVGARDGAGVPTLSRLTFDAPALRGLGGAGDTVTLVAGDVVLRNSTGGEAMPQGAGRLVIEAEPPLRYGNTGGIAIGPGSVALGFDTATLQSRGDVVFDGSGTVAAKGDVTIAAVRVTATTGADHGVTAGGEVTIARPADSRALGEQVGVGATLHFAGTRVVQKGTIDLPGGRIEMEASGSGGEAVAVEFAQGSVTRAGGHMTEAQDGWQLYGDGGAIAVKAGQGAIAVNGLLDVAALAGGGDGGEIELEATGAGGALRLGDRAQLRGAGGAGGEGGSLDADVGQLADGAGNATSEFDDLAGADGFTESFALRTRQGDLRLAAETLRAETVAVSADGGALRVDGVIDASAEQGGVVSLAARDDVTLGGGGRILAASSRAGANGGDVLLSSREGYVRVEAGSAIDAGGDDAADGRVILRAARSGNGVQVAPVAGSIDAGLIAIEAVKQYGTVESGANAGASYTSLGTGTTSALKLGQSSIASDLSNFMTNEQAILAALGLAGDSRAQVRAGVEIAVAGDFAVANDWNLLSVAGDGFLTIRAAGDLNVNGTLSDGFNGTARNSAIQSGNGWSYRLVGGADLAAVDVMRVAPSDTKGDVNVAGGKLIRTTTGSIEMAAGRDVNLQGTTANPATVMVAGAPSALPGDLAADFTAPSTSQFTAGGGRIAVQAGRDVTSPASDQIIANWLFHSGRLDNAGKFFASSNLAWWTRLDLFRHGFGSFGGGNVRLVAGRDVVNASAFAPTTGRMAAATPDASKLVVENGGDVLVQAGRDVKGGVYYVGRGEGRIEAGRDILEGGNPDANVDAMAPLLALNDGTWTVRAGGDVNLSGAFNPTMFASTNYAVAAGFFTYGADAALDVATTTGNFTWKEPSSNSMGRLAKLPTNAAEDLQYLNSIDPEIMSVAPPTVAVTAFSGDVDLKVLDSSLTLYPSALGNLTLFAAGDLRLDGSLRLMDNAPDALPSVTNPVWSNRRGPAAVMVGQTKQTTRLTEIDFSDLHKNDPEPVRIHAGGSLLITDGQRITLPKQAYISAGEDIVSLELLGQHHNAGDETVVSAGRNLINPTILGGRGLIMLAGPGLLRLEAGRQLDLGASSGVETVGNLYNPALPEQGASVRVAAGLARTLDASGFEKFLAAYLGSGGSPSGADYRDDLVNYVRAALGLPALSGAAREAAYADALARFREFPESARLAFVDKVVAAEFVRTYLGNGGAYADKWRAAAAKAGVSATDYSGRTFEQFRTQVLYAELWGSGITGSQAGNQSAKDTAYARGYKAIDLSGYGFPFSFAGDIDLVESKVQTKRGGDIEFLAPGGGINVGLSTDVSSTGVTKKSDDRGVVAFSSGNIRSFSDGDFQVNAQKVFVIGTGDISIWSSNGDIDSGRGANTTVTIPPLVPRLTDDGVVFELPSLATGSGIGILQPATGEASGQIGLFAPRGELIALDALIRAPGPIFVAAETVRGADNIVGGSVVGAPAPVVAAPTLSLGSTANPADTAARAGVDSGAPTAAGDKDPNSILTVEVLAFGDGTSCDPGESEEECERRRQTTQ